MGYKVINLPLHHSEIKTRASLLWCFWDLISLWSIYTHCYLVLMWSNYCKRGWGDGCGRWCCSLNNWVPMFPNLRFLTKKNIIKKILNFEFIEKWWKTVVPLRFLHSSTLFIPMRTLELSYKSCCTNIPKTTASAFPFLSICVCFFLKRQFSIFF